MNDTSFYLYKVFCTVAECKNYKKASDKLCITASTISSHIKNLEEKLSVTLFYREREGLILTEAGEDLYDRVHDKIKDIEFAESAIVQDYDISKAKLKIGCPSHISIFYLSKYISQIRKDYPNLKVDIIGAADYNMLVNLLQNHIVDFVIMDFIPQTEKNEMKVKELETIGNIFISKEPIKINDIKELEQYKYILNYESSISTKELFECLKKYDVNIKAYIQSDITEVRIEEVKQEQGIGYVIEEAIEKELENNIVHKVEMPIDLPKTKINLVYIEKYLTKIDKIFIKKYLKK